MGLEDRYIFHLPSGKELRPQDMTPWQTLDPVQAPAGDENHYISPHSPLKQFPLEVEGLKQEQTQFSRLGMNIGCHDEYPGDEPESDYISGPSFLSFESISISGD